MEVSALERLDFLHRIDDAPAELEKARAPPLPAPLLERAGDIRQRSANSFCSRCSTISSFFFAAHRKALWCVRLRGREWMFFGRKAVDAFEKKV